MTSERYKSKENSSFNEGAFAPLAIKKLKGGGKMKEKIIRVVFFDDGSAEVEFKTIDDYEGLKGDILQKMLEIIFETFTIITPPYGIRELVVYKNEDFSLDVEVKGEGESTEYWKLAGYVAGVSLLTAITLSKMEDPPNIVCPVN